MEAWEEGAKGRAKGKAPMPSEKVVWLGNPSLHIKDCHHQPAGAEGRVAVSPATVTTAEGEGAGGAGQWCPAAGAGLLVQVVLLAAHLPALPAVPCQAPTAWHQASISDEWTHALPCDSP